MNKKAFVINGRGGVGKDTLCDITAKHFKVMNVSSITPIKQIAKENGWKGEKTPKARRFLSELKRVFTEYNDLPNNYILGKYGEFLKGDVDIFFVHIREPEEIKRFVSGAEKLGMRPMTLLVTSVRSSDHYGNSSDDCVEDYDYDYVYANDKPLDEAEEDFLSFLDKIK